MEESLKALTEAAVATSYGLPSAWGVGPPDEDDAAKIKQDYWDWLSTILLQILRESGSASSVAGLPALDQQLN